MQNNPNFPGMGNNRPGIGGGGGLFSPMDPSYRSEISLTIEFRVTSSMDDDKAPWVKVNFTPNYALCLENEATSIADLRSIQCHVNQTQQRIHRRSTAKAAPFSKPR